MFQFFKIQSVINLYAAVYKLCTRYGICNFLKDYPCCLVTFKYLGNHHTYALPIIVFRQLSCNSVFMKDLGEFYVFSQRKPEFQSQKIQEQLSRIWYNHDCTICIRSGSSAVQLEKKLYLKEMCYMERPILFINACVRKESRTRKLAEKLLLKLNEPFEEMRLDMIAFPVVNEDFLTMRDRLISDQDFGNPVFDLARQFSEAETIVIAAPFWDLSFPAALKQFFEQINVVGITFRYTDDGVPVGLCKAKRLFYVTTAGGVYVPEEFGFGYIKALAQNFYGIQDVIKIQAAGLDICGADVDVIMNSAEAAISDIND